MNDVFKNMFKNEHPVVSSDKHFWVFIAQTHLLVFIKMNAFTFKHKIKNTNNCKHTVFCMQHCTAKANLLKFMTHKHCLVPTKYII